MFCENGIGSLWRHDCEHFLGDGRKTDKANLSTLVDVGGGNGSLMDCAVCSRNGAGGFLFTKVIPTQSPASVIEGIPE
jgi:hypothetical protein